MTMARPSRAAAGLWVSSRRAALIGLTALSALTLGGSSGAAELASQQFAGKTLSAVVYAANSPGPVGGRSLKRVMLQVYLKPDGTAVFRQWDAARDAYTRPAAASWSVSGERLCLRLPDRGFCVDVHIWGPRIAGVGIEPYAMLDGDLQRGDAIGAGR